ncbi:hypothetical protein Tco_0086499 [Tanacetum coccineum]
MRRQRKRPQAGAMLGIRLSLEVKFGDVMTDNQCFRYYFKRESEMNYKLFGCGAIITITSSHLRPYQRFANGFHGEVLQANDHGIWRYAGGYQEQSGIRAPQGVVDLVAIVFVLQCYVSDLRDYSFEMKPLSPWMQE